MGFILHSCMMVWYAKFVKDLLSGSQGMTILPTDSNITFLLHILRDDPEAFC